VFRFKKSTTHDHKPKWKFYTQQPPKKEVAQWQRLCEENKLSNASSFPSFAFASQSLLSDYDLIYAFCYKNKALVCVVPLTRIRKEMGYVRINVLQVINHSELDIFVPAYRHSESINSLIKSLCSAIRSQIDNWDYFLLENWLNTDVIYPGKIISYEKKTTYFDLNDKISISDLIPSKLLRNIRRNEKKIFPRRHTASLESFCKGEEFADALQSFFQLEHSGWKGEKGTSIQSNEDTQRFYRQFWTDDNKSSVTLLKLDDTILAGAITFTHDSILYLHKITYKESFGKFGPGSILIKNLLENLLLQSEISKLCFNSDPEWLTRWKPERYRLSAIELFNNTPKGIIFKIMFFSYRKIKNLGIKMSNLSFFLLR